LWNKIDSGNCEDAAAKTAHRTEKFFGTTRAGLGSTMNSNAENLMEETPSQLRERARALTQRARMAAQGTDEYVHENPWVAIGTAAVVGMVIGLLIGRKS
jgi:ElaB/YqjD/DUF883 family membrane-anchored ribosome-binding protein